MNPSLKSLKPFLQCLSQGKYLYQRYSSNYLDITTKARRIYNLKMSGTGCKDFDFYEENKDCIYVCAIYISLLKWSCLYQNFRWHSISLSYISYVHGINWLIEIFYMSSYRWEIFINETLNACLIMYGRSINWRKTKWQHIDFCSKNCWLYNARFACMN